MATVVSAPRSGNSRAAVASSSRPPALRRQKLPSGKASCGSPIARSSVYIQRRKHTFAAPRSALAEDDVGTKVTDTDPIADVAGLPDTPLTASAASRLQLIEEDFQSQPATRVVCLIPGGIVEQIYFFPILAALRQKYPAAAIDVVTSPEAVSAYALCPYVRNTIPYKLEGTPILSALTTADYQDILGKIKYEGYDVLISAKPAGLAHGIFLFLTAIDKKYGIYAKFNAAGAIPYLRNAAKARAEELADLGVTMYDDLARVILEDGGASGVSLPSLSECGLGVPEKALSSLSTPPKQKTVVIHGVISSSKGAMVARGKGAELLTPEVIMDIAKKVVTEGGRAVVAVPYRTDLEKIDIDLENVEVVECLTPLSIAAQIARAKAVIAAPTAALPIAEALGKPTVCVTKALDIAETFAPFATPLLIDDLTE